VNSPARTVALWSGLLAALAAVLLGWTRDELQLGLLAGAAAAALALAGVFAVLRPRRGRPAPVLSFATLLLAAGMSLALLGVGFGLWLLLPGAGLALIGLASLARERRAAGAP
jgi:hypothetical protein